MDARIIIIVAKKTAIMIAAETQIRVKESRSFFGIRIFDIMSSPPLRTYTYPRAANYSADATARSPILVRAAQNTLFSGHYPPL